MGMSKIAGLTTLQWKQACDCGLVDSVPLAKADISRPFVYERHRGVFYVPGGLHLIAMSFLLALQHHCVDGVDVANQLKLEYPGATADHWLLHTEGAAFRSSVGKRIVVATGRGLTVLERRLFGDFERVFN